MAQQRLLRANSPIVRDVDERPVLHECPDAGTIKIAPRFERESNRPAGFRDAERPAQGIRQPALGMQLYNATDSALTAVLDFPDGQVHRGPPARKLGRL